MDSKSMQPGATPGLSAMQSGFLPSGGQKNDCFMTTEEKKTKPEKKRFYRKRARLFNLVDKIKLWASRTGQLHGIKSLTDHGENRQAYYPLQQGIHH